MDIILIIAIVLLLLGLLGVGGVIAGLKSIAWILLIIAVIVIAWRIITGRRPIAVGETVQMAWPRHAAYAVTDSNNQGENQ